MENKIKHKGLLVLKQVEFDDYLKRRVHKSNKTSGKITVPTNWIGKQVYVILTEQNGKK